MSFSVREDLTENKLILLYIMNGLNIPATSSQIIKLVVNNNIMDYFTFQQLISELCECKFLDKKLVDSKVTYEITTNGKQALLYFANRIPNSIKKFIDGNLVTTRSHIKNEININADYIPAQKGSYLVSCYVKENDFLLMELKLTVGSQNEARTICNNWHKNPQRLYLKIIESVLNIEE